jgi:hypothetical protein
LQLYFHFIFLADLLKWDSQGVKGLFSPHDALFWHFAQLYFLKKLLHGYKVPDFTVRQTFHHNKSAKKYLCRHPSP